MKKRIISFITSMILLLSVFTIGAFAGEPTYPVDPDGGTYTEYNHKGSDKKVTVHIRDSSTNRLLKDFVIYGPAGEYFVESIKFWGYDYVSDSFPWHLTVSSERVKGFSDNLAFNGQAYLLQVGTTFAAIFSPSAYEATAYFTPHTCEASVKHYLVDATGMKTLYTTETKNLTFDSYFNAEKKTVANYALNPEYLTAVGGNFRWTMLGESENMSKYKYSATFHSETLDGVEESYYDNRKIDIDFVYTLNNYEVKYDANGGYGAPATQTKYYDVPLMLSSDKPTRNGYTFIGWGLTKTSTYISYYPASNYTSNSGRTLYAVWKSDNAVYTVSYNANGGYGAPASQIKYHNTVLKLRDNKPTKDGYTFIGWSTDSGAKSASYLPGGSYNYNASVTLYAVWEQINYEFSISDIELSATEAYRYDTVSVTVRTDSWDKVNAYSDIPVELLFDDEVIYTEYCDFSPYGSANLSFDVGVAGSVGEHTVSARINWEDHMNETETENNIVSDTLTVITHGLDLRTDSVNPNTETGYIEGDTVITSFTVSNNGERNILPTDNNTVRFTAYYYDNTEKVVIDEQEWEQFVIPKDSSNLVYFKWTVPENTAGISVYCECIANSGLSFDEIDPDNNKAVYTSVIAERTVSQTPNTGYVDKAPADYSAVSPPEQTNETAAWTQWEYIDGEFVLKYYNIRISDTVPIITPSVNCISARYSSGTWTMRSGYGIGLSYSPFLTSTSVDTLPGTTAYTSIQSVTATFPEYKYSTSTDKCATLEYADDEFAFNENTGADGNERIHYIPVYVNDGGYIVSVTVNRIWTPVGIISATRNSVPITIDGSIYDDYYVGDR